ncbi:MAG: pentapeptide repeat-containing protein [Vampirovibrionales bacterium]
MIFMMVFFLGVLYFTAKLIIWFILLTEKWQKLKALWGKFKKNCPLLSIVFAILVLVVSLISIFNAESIYTYCFEGKLLNLEDIKKAKEGNGEALKNALTLIGAFRTNMVSILTALCSSLVGIAALLNWRETQKNNRIEQRNNLLTKSIELLNPSNSTAREGALVLLEQLMRDDPETMGRRIVQLLVSFIKYHAQHVSMVEEKSFFYDESYMKSVASSGLSYSTKPYQDIKRAFEILAERNLPEAIEATLNFDFRDIDHSFFHDASWNLYQVYAGKENQNLKNVKGKGFVRARLDTLHAPGVDFSECDMRGASLQKANLTKSIFFCTHLEDANLNQADLRGAKLINVHLGNANLEGTKLQDTICFYADMRNIRLSLPNHDDLGTKLDYLRGMNISGANLRDAHELQGFVKEKDNIQTELLTKAIKVEGKNLWDNNTIFPDGYDVEHEHEMQDWQPPLP